MSILLILFDSGYLIIFICHFMHDVEYVVPKSNKQILNKLELFFLSYGEHLHFQENVLTNVLPCIDTFKVERIYVHTKESCFLSPC